MTDGARRDPVTCPFCSSKFLYVVAWDPIRCPSCQLIDKQDDNRKRGRRKSTHTCRNCGHRWSTPHRRPIGE